MDFTERLEMFLEGEMITVDDVRIAMVSNVATVYITASDSSVFKGYLEADEALILIRKGDKIKINYAASEIDKLYIISSWSFIEEEKE